MRQCAHDHYRRRAVEVAQCGGDSDSDGRGWVHAEPQRLPVTLASLRAHAPGVAVVLLPDEPDAETRAALAAVELPQLGTNEPRGGPACWNRLIAAVEADMVVLLESGAVLAPGALESLVAALGAGVGLAGPSTNPAWNE